MSASPVPTPARAPVLVTGASSGIGLAIVEALAARGVPVWAGARRAEDLARLGTLPGVQPVALDVRDTDHVASLASALDAGPGLAGLVHNAGLGELGLLASWTDADLQRLFDVNVFGPHRLTRACLPALLRARGRVVCIGSQGGSLTMPFFGPYTMTKHALEAYAACLRQELAPHGVAVSIVQPGAVATRIGDNAQAANLARLQSTPPPFDARPMIQALTAPPAPDPAQPESATQRRPAPPQAVAAVVLDALFGAAPKARVLFGTRWEGDRVIDALLERLLDANDSPSHGLSRDELVARLDAALARRA